MDPQAIPEIKIPKTLEDVIFNVQQTLISNSKGDLQQVDQNDVHIKDDSLEVFNTITGVGLANEFSLLGLAQESGPDPTAQDIDKDINHWCKVQIKKEESAFQGCDDNDNELPSFRPERSNMEGDETQEKFCAESDGYKSQEKCGQLLGNEVPQQCPTIFLDAIKDTEDIQRERINQLQNENRNLRFHLEQCITRHDNLVVRLNEAEGSNSRSLILAKKLDDQLKSLNKKYGLLQKKVTNLEKENKELATSLKTCETEKKSLSEKWLKLSKKTRIDDNYKANCKNFETELALKNKELEELGEKFYMLKAEVQYCKDNERNYRRVLKEQAQKIEFLNEKYEADRREKDFLVSKNIELIEKLEKAQQKIQRSHAKVLAVAENNQTFDNNNNTQDLQKTIERIETEEAVLAEQVRCLSSQLVNVAVTDKAYDQEGARETVDGEGLTAHANCDRELDQPKDNEEHVKAKNDAESNCTLSTTEDCCEYQTLCLNYNPSEDEGLKTLKSELEQKLNKEDYESIQLHLEQHINYMSNLMNSDKGVGKYNKLLLHYFKALEKIKTLDKGYTRINQRLESNETVDLTISGLPLNSSLYRETETHPVNLSNINSLASYTRVPTRTQGESILFDRASFDMMTSMQTNKEKKYHLFMETHADAVLHTDESRSKSLEKFKVIKKSLNDDGSGNKPKNFKNLVLPRYDDQIANLSPLKSTSRSKSTSKTNRSYHEIHTQRRRDNPSVQLNLADYMVNRAPTRSIEREAC